MKYYIIAGEASGDLHGSHLVRALKDLDPEAVIRAWGGNKMQDAGAELVKHYKDHNYMGFAEVIIHLRKILSNIRFCKNDISVFQPDVLVLIDFPGFNLRIAKWAHSQGIKVVYYISPQVWAWKSSRVYTIKKVVDIMITILPFEKDFYAGYEMETHYVGHPLLDSIKTEIDVQQKSCKYIALLPGSRKQEIRRMLPVMTSLIPEFPDYQFIIAGAQGIDEQFYRKYSTAPCEVQYNQLYAILSHSAAALVTSGTATLETALTNTPLVVCYKSTRLSYMIAKKLIRVKFISLVNLIMDREVVKELIQDSMNKKNLTKELTILLQDETTKKRIFADYTELRNKLGNSGASKRAAELITQLLNVNKQ